MTSNGHWRNAESVLALLSKRARKSTKKTNRLAEKADLYEFLFGSGRGDLAAMRPILKLACHQDFKGAFAELVRANPKQFLA